MTSACSYSKPAHPDLVSPFRLYIRRALQPFRRLGNFVARSPADLIDPIPEVPDPAWQDQQKQQDRYNYDWSGIDIGMGDARHYFTFLLVRTGWEWGKGIESENPEPRDFLNLNGCYTT
jgi:hypothetical protein